MFEILCVIPCPVNLDGYLYELDEKNNDLDAMLHFKRTLNNVKKNVGTLRAETDGRQERN